MRARLCSAFAAACLAAFAAGLAAADPSLWVVKSRISTVYLFGTLHAMTPSQAWRTPALDKAFRESDELWEEIPNQAALPVSGAPASPPEEAQRLARLTATLVMTTDGPPLSSRLTAEEAATLAANAPIPQARLDRLRPWAAADVVQASFLQKIGVTGAAGADLVLAEEAGAQGKPVRGLETMEQQLHFLADLSPDEEMSYLRKMLADVVEGRAYFEAFERAWRAGDDAAAERLGLARMREMAPAVYRRLVIERNHRWLPQIKAMLANPGVRFVAVGGGHLVGPDGLIALLRNEGWKVERVE